MLTILKSLKGKSTRWIFSVCYLLLIVLVIVIYCFVYIKSVNILKNEIDTNRINAFSIFRRDFDELLSYDYEIIDFIKADREALELSDINIYKDEKATMKCLLNVRTSISKIEKKSQNPIKIYLYFPLAQKCVSSVGISNAKDFYNFSFLDTDNYSEWCSQVLSDSVTAVSLQGDIIGAESNKKTESVMVTDAIRTYDGIVYCSVIFCIPNSTVEAMIEQCGINPKSNTVIVSDFNGEEVINVGQNKQIKYETKTIIMPGYNFSEEDNDVSVKKFKSQVKKLTYVNYMSESVYYESLRLQKNIILSSAFIISLVGVLIMLIFYKHQHGNINEVMAELSINDKYRDEFKVIKNSINRINEENRNLKDFKQIAVDFARDAVFYRLTTGEFGIDSFEQNVLESFGICFNEPNFAIVQFKEKENTNSVRLAYLGGLLLELLEPDFSHFYTYNQYDSFCIVFNLSDIETRYFKRICLEELANIREDEDENIKHSYIVTVSDIYKGNKALYEAMKNILLQVQTESEETVKETIVSETDINKDIASIEDKIDEFIFANYSDCELSLQLISDAFNMNPVYLSNMYKKRRKKGILTSITECRIEKAKELLLNEDLSVSEVSVRVGYLYPKNFSRVFKKHCGVSPNDFKKTKQLNNE